MHEILLRPVSSIQLVFGLDWLPLISGRASSAARRFARQRKATHFVLGDESPAAFGYGFIRKAHRSGTTLHSAAQCMARLYPKGSLATVVSVEPDGYWMVAVQEGAVMATTDKVFATYDDAINAVRTLQKTSQRLITLIDAQVPTLEEIASGHHSGTTLRSTGLAIRKWIFWVVLSASIVTALVWFQRTISPRAVVPAPALDASQINAQWMQALRVVEQRIAIHGVAATHEMLRHLYAVPAQMAGWTLARLICTSQTSSWHCVADFDRDDQTATNQGILDQAPANWSFSFAGMDRAVAIWSFDQQLPVSAQWQIKDSAYNQRHLQSRWQGVKPAFTRMSLGPASPLAIEVPRGVDGVALPIPADFRAYAKRAVELHGPLRSLSVLLPYTHAIGWRSITLTTNQNIQPSLTSSRLTASLQGDLYEQYVFTPPTR